MLTGNKGDWSEVYALFKILSDGNLFPGDANVKKIEGLFYPIISILRKELQHDRTFSIVGKTILITDGINEPVSISVEQFASEAASLLANIKLATGPSFSISSAETFLRSFGSNTVKANSTTKADLIIQIHDSRTKIERALGFSIKSQLGRPSTLLNASSATNLTFKLEGPPLSQQEIDGINAINTSSKIRDRINSLYRQGCTLSFLRAENKTFHNNLVLIDSLLPTIIAHSLIGYYKDNVVSALDICSYLTNRNPLEFDQSLNHKFYEHKLKRFLSEIALGMMPNTTWTGEYDGTEGYIVIKEDGDAVCYHIINRNLFEDYLLANTRIDTPSSTRHGFGSIYTLNSEQLFKLNFQIRFL